MTGTARHWFRRSRAVVLLAAALGGTPVPDVGTRATAPIGPFFSAVTVGYSPSGEAFSVHGEALASRDDIERDLRALRDAGFEGLVTYAASGTLGAVPQMAREIGFRGPVIMGIWDPASAEEWAQALAQAAYVDGYCVGNEGLAVRYQPEMLAQRMAQLRSATGRPVTTSEPIDRYLSGPHREWLIAHSDWLFPIAHPYWAEQVDPHAAVDWLVAHHDLLVADSGRAVVLKEAGVPTAGVPGYSEGAQLRFFALLEETRVSFVHFEAFDQPWKSMTRSHAAEAHWGLFASDGTPKEVVAWLKSRRITR